MNLEVFDLGQVDYPQALEQMKAQATLRAQEEVKDALFVVEHPPTLTLGRAAKRENILVSPEALQSAGVGVYETGRGGDVTYHGPGQLIYYPVISLSPHRKDVRRYVSDLEQVMIDVCAHFGLEARRSPGQIGCWIQGQRKIGAIGVRISKWVTTHGFAFNVAPNMKHFELIVPCGISDKPVTSLELELETVPSMETVKAVALQAFRERFQFI